MSDYQGGTMSEPWAQKEAKELARPILIKHLFTADDLPKSVAHLMEDLYPVIAAALERVDRRAMEREKRACVDHLEAMASVLAGSPEVSYRLRSAAASLRGGTRATVGFRVKE